MARRRFVQDQQLDLFIITPNSSDIRSKHVKDLMTWGTFNISKKPKKALLHQQGDFYLNVEAGKGNNIATYNDNDLMIFLTSHLVQAINQGQKKHVSPVIEFTANEFFSFTGKRHIGGTRYDQIWNSLQRLNDTFVHTNIDLGGGTNLESRWNWLPEVHRLTSTATGKSTGFQVRIANPIYKAITQDTPQVLTLDRRYFDLTSGFRKFLYLYARKSAGYSENEWIVSERFIHARSGSSMELSQFRKLLKTVTDEGQLCDYKIKQARRGSERAIAFIRDPMALEAVHKTTIVIEE